MTRHLLTRREMPLPKRRRIRPAASKQSVFDKGTVHWVELRLLLQRLEARHEIVVLIDAFE